MANFRTTRPEFGNVEAYARRHRRIVPVLGTTIQLSLQQAEWANPSGSLKRLVDGSAFNVELLSTIVPSLRGLIWEFRSSAVAAGFELITVADDIEVVLFTAEDPGSTFELEGRLRGIAARIVVALEYGVSPYGAVVAESST
jgi:hypothetical protein